MLKIKSYLYIWCYWIEFSTDSGSPPLPTFEEVFGHFIEGPEYKDNDEVELRGIKIQSTS